MAQSPRPVGTWALGPQALGPSALGPGPLCDAQNAKNSEDRSAHRHDLHPEAEIIGFGKLLTLIIALRGGCSCFRQPGWQSHSRAADVRNETRIPALHARNIVASPSERVFRTSYPFPVWTGAPGFHLQNVGCCARPIMSVGKKADKG